MQYRDESVILDCVFCDMAVSAIINPACLPRYGNEYLYLNSLGSRKF